MKLRQFREQAGLSLTDLGVRVRLSTSYLTEIEHGKKYPKAEKIARMAAALGREQDMTPLRQLRILADLDRGGRVRGIER